MNIEVQPGQYVLAVSGGVDSVVLLDVLVQKPDIDILVAHYDHGIRDDSAEDRRLVQVLAKQYGLPFIYDEGSLGKNASEAIARDARYSFLQRVKDTSKSRAIITAHHQDDVIETAVLNLLRGTGRKGLSSLRSTDSIVRPLLHMPKKELVNYAKAHKLQWREDSTNLDQAYKRNYVRHKLKTKLTSKQREQFVTYITDMHDLNHQIDIELTNYLHMQPGVAEIERYYFVQLPHAIAVEVMAEWLRRVGLRDFDARLLHRLVVAAKTFRPGTVIDVSQGLTLSVTGRNLALELRDR